MNDETIEHKGGERIAKVIARAGLASRREAEQWIAGGRVAVNGSLIQSPAHKVTARDNVTVDGEPLPARERTRLFLYHKPRGLMTTHSDPQGRPTIFEHLPKNLPRLISVGRLDFTTEGLLLLTNDGALARVLELPATGWLRRYRVRAHGSVTQPQLDELRKGVTVDGIHYGAIEAAIDRVQGSNLWLTFAIREGKNREVRNVLGQLGLAVTRLIRVSFGPFQIKELAEGAVEEVPTRVLREQLGARLVAQSGVDFSAPIAAAPPRKRDDPRKSASPQKQDDARRSTPPQKRDDPRRSPPPQRRDDARSGTPPQKRDDPRRSPPPQRRDDARSSTPPQKRDDPRRSPPSQRRDDARSNTPPQKRDDPRRNRPLRKQDDPQAASPQKSDNRRKSTPAKPTSHSWRALREEGPKKLRRKFHGSRRDDETTRAQPAPRARADEIVDRKGRRVHVERFGQPPTPEPPKKEMPKRGRYGRRVAPDRAAGARPRHPRGRR